MDVAIGELDVPANVRLVIDRRLARLDDETRRVLSVAAVAGRHVGFDLWEAIADITDEASSTRSTKRKGPGSLSPKRATGETNTGLPTS